MKLITMRESGEKFDDNSIMTPILSKEEMDDIDSVVWVR